MRAVRKPKIIVSGFEGFGGRSINASAELAKAMAAEFSQYELTFVQVPVIWGAPMEADRSKLRDFPRGYSAMLGARFDHGKALL